MERHTDLPTNMETAAHRDGTLPVVLPHSPPHPLCPWYPFSMDFMVLCATFVLHAYDAYCPKKVEGLRSSDLIDFLRRFHDALPSHQHLREQLTPVWLPFRAILWKQCENTFVHHLVDMVKPSFETFSHLPFEFSRLLMYRSVFLKRTVYGAFWFKLMGWPYHPETDGLYGWADELDSSVVDWTSMTLDRDHITYSTEVLGNGGSAQVVKGSYKGQPVAIKILLPQPSIRDLFFGNNVLRDFRNWKHENVVQTYGVTLYPCCEVMELLPYSATIINSHQQSRQQKLATILYAARGLQYIHCVQHHAHGDLKLANLLISDTGIIKIADLNGARETGHDRFKFTDVGKPVFTETHAPPELLRPEMTRWMVFPADMFAFGITMLQVMQAPATLRRRTASSLSLPWIDPLLFEGVEQIKELIKQCLSDEPEDRPHISEIVQVMERLCPNNDNMSVLPASVHSSGQHPDLLMSRHTLQTNLNGYTAGQAP
eukprot:TRINITY_DN1020_c0_g2_i4.p1 TRINITY_DN1020_c0_g2~~TRINITY_DN1020_c0_g2_i4.p1  ORF type:complete len:485 (-),score=43.83 TRINITY_DN1020_c0_g2_i4:78-1532(-)